MLDAASTSILRITAGWCATAKFFVSGAAVYDRRLLEPRSFEEIMAWHQRLCRSIDCVPPALALGEPPPPPGAFDFLEDKKVLMAEAYHQERVIVLYPPGLRLATLCHELAHLLTGQDHTVDLGPDLRRSGGPGQRAASPGPLHRGHARQPA